MHDQKNTIQPATKLKRHKNLNAATILKLDGAATLGIMIGLAALVMAALKHGG